MRKLGKYELLGELGRGAFGIVYRARDPVINRMAALKTMTTGVADNPSLLERFYREAQSAGFLQHPNIVTVYEMGDEAGTPFIAMELVDGPNLDELISRRASLPLSLKVNYVLQASRALDYAHKRGIIHRDIKPGNVMVNGEGVVKVVDFGIARLREVSKTQTGTLIGTFSYMAPELFHGERATERSDIWSLGVLLYELVAYKQPFVGHSPASLMQAICVQEPVPLRQVAPECPDDLESVVRRMLQKTEGERFQTMEDLLLELDPISRRLQRESVAAMLAGAGELMQQGAFAEARQTLRQAMQLDPTNLEARTLSEKISAELKRLAARKQAEQHVEQGRKLLEQGKPREAGAEVDSALQADSKFEPAQALQTEIQRELERRRVVEGYLELARQRLIEDLPEDAEALLLKARELDRAHPQLLRLQQQVAEEKARRHQRSRLLEGMRGARLLWLQRNYPECLAALTALQREFPGEDEIVRLMETAREDQAEQSKQQQLAQAHDLLVSRRFEECTALLRKLQQEFPKEEEIERLLETARADRVEDEKQHTLAEARKLLSSRRYEECQALLTKAQQQLPQDEEISRLLATAREDQAERDRKERLATARELVATQRFADALALLDSLLASDPNDSAVLKLRTLAQREQESQARSEALQREWDALKKLVNEHAYSEAAARAETLLHQFPGEASLLRLLEFAREQQAQVESDRRLRSTREQVQDLMHANRFAEAAAAAQAGLESFPADADLSALLKQAEARKKSEMVRQLIERRVREIKVKINRGELSEAKELAQETLATLGSDTDVHQLLSSAEVEYEAREKRRRQEAQLDRIRTLMKEKKLTEATSALEAIIQSGDFDTFDPRLHEIAAAQSNSNASTVPLVEFAPESPAKEYVLLDGPPLPAAEPDSPTRAPQPPPQPAPSKFQPAASAETRVEITPAIIADAARKLAPHVGPIATVLSKRAALRADSLRSFYLLLAEYVDNKNERLKFLRSGGFPED